MACEIRSSPFHNDLHFVKDWITVETIEVASSSQCSNATNDQGVDTSDFIISSPYTELHHQLSLSSLPDQQSSLLARSLQTLEKVTPDYAVVPYVSALNWDNVISSLRRLCRQEGHFWKKQTFYIVAFMSQLKEDADRNLLSLLDKESHAEAVEKGGLLKYWFGSPNAERRNLATCVWVSEKYAKLGGTGPWHRRARIEAPNLYEQITFKRMDLVIDDNVTGWKIE